MKKYAFLVLLLACYVQSKAKEHYTVPLYGFKTLLIVPGGDIAADYQKGFALDWSRAVRLGKKNDNWQFRFGIQYAYMENRVDSTFKVNIATDYYGNRYLYPELHLAERLRMINPYFDFSRLLYRHGKFDVFASLGGELVIAIVHEKIVRSGQVETNNFGPSSVTFRSSLMCRYKVNSRLFYIAECAFVPATDVDYGQRYTHSTFGLGVNYTLHEE